MGRHSSRHQEHARLQTSARRSKKPYDNAILPHSLILVNGPTRFLAGLVQSRSLRGATAARQSPNRQKEVATASTRGGALPTPPALRHTAPHCTTVRDSLRSLRSRKCNGSREAATSMRHRRPCMPACQHISFQIDSRGSIEVLDFSGDCCIMEAPQRLWRNGTTGADGPPF